MKILLLLFSIMYSYACIGEYIHESPVPLEARRFCWALWIWSYTGGYDCLKWVGELNSGSLQEYYSILDIDWDIQPKLDNLKEFWKKYRNKHQSTP